MSALDQFSHSSWVTAGATLAGYGVVLAVMFLLLFAVPYLVFAFAL